MTKVIESIEEYFSELEDCRIDRNRRHKLIDIIVISICATLSRCEDFVEIADYGEVKKKWLKTFLELPNGIPSHDTFTRVFRRLDPEGFQRCFSNWVESLRREISGEIVSIDGKTIRRAVDKASAQAGLHVVSAWANENELSLGQVAVENKSNEIVAIPKLLALLDLQGCVVTIDAGGCYSNIASDIRDKKADYVFALKANQPSLYKKATELFKSDADVQFFETNDNNHGRLENRQYYITSDIESLNLGNKWRDIRSIGMVVSSRQINGKTSTQTRYFITSLKNNAKKFAKAVRKHWGIENSLHWILDVIFNEDYSRSRKDNSTLNLAALRKIAINLAKADKKSTKSIKVRRLIASLDDNYLLKLLTQNNSNVSNA